MSMNKKKVKKKWKKMEKKIKKIDIRKKMIE